MRNIAAVLKIGENLLKKGRILQDLIQLSKVILITDNELKETNYFFKKKHSRFQLKLIESCITMAEFYQKELVQLWNDNCHERFAIHHNLCTSHLETLSADISIREKCPNTESFLAHIFPHSDWIWSDTSYLSVFSPNAGKYGSEIEDNQNPM